MSDLLEGFTEAGDAPASNNPDSFEAGLAAAVGKEPVEATGATPTTPADPALSTGQQIVAGLLDPATDPNVANGITVKDDEAPEQPSDAVTLSDGQTYAAPEIDSAIKRAAENEEELQSFRDSEAGEIFEADLEEAGLDAEEYAEGVVAAAGEQAVSFINGEISPEAYADFRERAVEALAEAYLPEQDDGTYDPTALEQLRAMLDEGARQYALERRAEDVTQQMPELIGKAADQRAVEIKAVLTQWSRDQGIKDPQVREMRLRNAEAVFEQTHGYKLGDLFSRIDVTSDQLYEALAEADAQVATALFAQRDLAFKQELLGAGGGSLSEGLEIEGRRVVQHDLPSPDPARLSRRVDAFKNRQRYTHQNTVKATFADGPSVKEGWTEKGRPVKQSAIDGSKAAWDAEEKRRKEEARGF
jgi:hypothetical protein